MSTTPRSTKLSEQRVNKDSASAAITKAKSAAEIRQEEMGLWKAFLATAKSSDGPFTVKSPIASVGDKEILALCKVFADKNISIIDFSNTKLTMVEQATREKFLEFLAAQRSLTELNLSHTTIQSAVPAVKTKFGNIEEV